MCAQCLLNLLHNQENYAVIKCRFHSIFIRTDLLVIVGGFGPFWEFLSYRFSDSVYNKHIGILYFVLK